jgi:hypothetical protein
MQMTVEAMANYMKEIYHSFGHMPDEQWLFLAKHSCVEMDEGGYKMSYDPAIAVVFSVCTSTNVRMATTSLVVVVRNIDSVIVVVQALVARFVQCFAAVVAPC